MASFVPLKEKRLMEDKIGELPRWRLMQGFTPKGYHRYYNKHINVKKGGTAGASMVLATYVFFNYCRSYKELKHEQRHKYR